MSAPVEEGASLRSLDEVKQAWRRVRQRVAREFSMLASNFNAFLPVAVEPDRLRLKGRYASEAARSQMQRNLLALETVCAEELEWRRLKLAFEDGELAEDERFIQEDTRHLRGEGRLKALDKEHPGLAELVRRMEGRIIE